MLVDIDDVRAEIECSYRKYEEELRGEKNMNYRRMLYGILAGYRKVEIMLYELEKVYRERESECVRSSREKGYEEYRNV